MDKDLQVRNYLEAQLRTLKESDSLEYRSLYASFKDEKLVQILASLHSEFVKLFEMMNERLPAVEGGNTHFWADPSRDLISRIQMAISLVRTLSGSGLDIKINAYYADLFKTCKTFLSQSGGSILPIGMDQVNIYYVDAIFEIEDTLDVKSSGINKSFSLEIIGEGSYAKVFKYYDDYYNRYFVVKRARKDLNPKELIRFRREFDEMSSLNSPYVVEVYQYNDTSNEYVMEFMDQTLESYIQKQNQSLSKAKRIGICRQILKGFDYLHLKKLHHRDISPKNILVKKCEDVDLFKISDFGLVKTPDSFLTSINTETKGYFNDPALGLEGFSTYDTPHEIYAITRIILFVLTGKTKTEKLKEPVFIKFRDIGMNPDKSKRFKSVRDMITLLNEV